MNRKHKIITGEIYHIYNRGIDARKIFTSKKDLNRFIDSLIVMNNIRPIEHLRDHKIERSPDGSLVEIIAYCVLDNHFHFLMKQKIDGGISEFMKRVGGGYTLYFNKKHRRSGSLFQGKYKYVHVASDDYLTTLVAYVHANYIVHPNKLMMNSDKTKMIVSSLTEDTKANPYQLCQNIFNPDDIKEKNFKKWCEDRAQHTYKNRQESEQVRNHEIK